MKLSNLTFLIAGILFFTAASGDEIPSAFRGRWADTAAVCKSKGPAADTVITIKNHGYEGYEMYCNVKKIKTLTSNLFISSGTCNQEGNESPATIKLELFNNGRELKISGQKVIKC